MPPAPRDAADTLEDLAFLAEHGTTSTDAARRVGFASRDALEKWLQRHGGRDVYAALRANDPIELGQRRASLHLVRTAS